MNKLFKNCLLTITTTLTIGLGVFAANSTHKINEADAITGSMHYYVKVTNESDLHVGDTILLFTGNGRTFDAAAGNPRFYRLNFVSGVNNDVTRAYADESQIKRFQLGQGLVDEKSAELSPGVPKQSFSLKLLDYPGFADIRGKYLNHTEDRNTVLPHDRETVGYYYTPICFKDFSNGQVDGHASWEFTWLEGEENFHITRQDEPNKSDYALCYGGSSARPALDYSWNQGGLTVLKEITFNASVLKESNPILITADPKRSQYYGGETPDLSGLEIAIYFKDEKVITASYDNEPSFFKATSKVKNDGHIVVEYCGISFSIPVEIIEKTVNTNSYSLLNGPLEDYRGTYIAVVDLGGEYSALVSTAIDSEPKTKAIVNTVTPDGKGVIKLSTESSLAENGHPFKIERLTVEGQSRYFIHVLNGYLSFTTAEYHDGELIAKERAALTAEDAITIDNGLHIRMNNKTLLFNTTFFFDNSIGQEVKLYKLMTDEDFETHVNNYVTTFISGTAEACLAENVTSSIWQNLANAFNNLTVDEQGYFASLSYNHIFEETNSAENVADRYDYIVAKYKYNDFMNRKDAGTWKDYFNFDDGSLPAGLSKILGTSVDSPVFYTVITIASISILTIALFVVVKRKHQ